jgi:hypothetical protein
MAAISTNFSDLLDPRFQKLFNGWLTELPDRLGDFYTKPSATSAPTRADFRVSQLNGFSNVPEFTGSVSFQETSQGYDSTVTYKEYATGFQVERKLFDDDLYAIMDGKPTALADAYYRTRQAHGAQLFNNAFSNDTTWLSGGDGVSLCNDSHTTTSGASTVSGFDNKITAGLSATALTAARILMRGFRGPNAERISVMPDELLVPVNLYDVAYEITESEGKPDTANNNANVHYGKYKCSDWEYLTDTNDWFLMDARMRKQVTYWIDRIPYEFAMVEDIDTITAKWRLYARYGAGWSDWRWVLGSQVA